MTEIETLMRLAALNVIGLLSAVAFAAAAPRGATVAVAGWPGADASTVADIVVTAGGKIVGGTALSNVIVVTSDEPGFVRRLYSAGALLVFHPSIAGGCLVTTHKG